MPGLLQFKQAERHQPRFSLRGAQVKLFVPILPLPWPIAVRLIHRPGEQVKFDAGGSFLP